MSVYKAYIYAHGFVIFTHFCLLLDSRCQAFSACFRKSISRLGRCGRCAIATATSVGPPISESQPSNYDWVFSVSVCFPCYLFSHPFHPFNSLGKNNFPSKWEQNLSRVNREDSAKAYWLFQFKSKLCVYRIYYSAHYLKYFDSPNWFRYFY